jgi:hypothetical protein
VLWLASCGGEDLIGFEEQDVVVVAASGEEFSVGVPGDAADLLRVAGDAREECHASMPVEQIPLILVRPFDRVEVDVADFIANEEFLGVHEDHRVTNGAASVGGRSKTNIRDWRRLLTVEAWVGVERTPERDPSVSTTDGKDC